MGESNAGGKGIECRRIIKAAIVKILASHWYWSSRNVAYSSAHQMQHGNNKERGKPIIENVRWVGMQAGIIDQKMLHINK